MRIPLIPILCAMFLAGGPVMAGDAVLGPIQIKAAWSRATPPGGETGAAFLTVVNTGSTDDSLDAAAADVAKTVELHSHIMEGNIMKMRAVPSIPVAAASTVTLAPGGYHVMLIGLNQPLHAGDHFPVTLTFRQAGKVTVMVDVGGMGAAGANAGMPMMQDSEHQKMHQMMHGGE